MEFNSWSGRLMGGIPTMFRFFFGGFIVALLTLLGNPGYHIDK